MYSERKSQRRRGCMYIFMGLVLSLVFLATAETVAVAAACFLAVALVFVLGGLYYLVRGFLPEKKAE